jgi:serine/threonine protein phosphatase 1
MKQFVIGDIHGRAEALLQCLERSGFDYSSDQLICLGDVCDRGPAVKESFDILLRIKNLIYVLGNHDKWFLDWALKRNEDDFWQYHYGYQTINSYSGEDVPQQHIDLLTGAFEYYIVEDMLFVHAGIIPFESLKYQSDKIFLWDRDLVYEAWEKKDEQGADKITQYKEVFVGHTPTNRPPFNSQVPVCLKGVCLMDTGAGVGGRLSIMDIDSKVYWQSDVLY